MTAREMLEEVRSLDLKVKLITDRIIELEAMLMPGIDYDKVGVQGSKGDNRVNIIYKLSDTREELIAKRAELFALKSEIVVAMSQLSRAVYIQVLDLRYFQRKKWYAVARSMHYDIRWCQRLCEQAIQELDEILTAKSRI